jgi:hypothetical protein
MGKNGHRPDLDRLADDPGAWSRLDDRTFEQVFKARCLRFAADAQVDPQQFEPLYSELEARFGPEEREHLEEGLLAVILQGTPARALVPFFLLDSDLRIVSKAALDYSVLRLPDERGGQFAGPRLMLDTARPDSGQCDERRAGILMGVVLLGDRRLLPLLEGCWKWLGPAGRELLAKATSNGVITAGPVEFYLAWLEQTEDDRDFGGILGTLCRMASISPDGLVHDIERTFPVRPDEPPLRVIESWSFPEYFERIRERIERLTERESEPKLTPQLARYWCEGDDEPSD